MNTTKPLTGPGGRLADVLLWAAVLAVFAPSLVWIAQVAISREQVRDGVAVLFFALVCLMSEDGRTAGWTVRFGWWAVVFVTGACVLAGVAGVIHQPLPLMVALGLLAGGVVLYLFGDGVLPLATGLAVAFSGFVILAVLFPFADVPLRLFAGRAAMSFLDFIGRPSDLLLAGDPLRLVLVSGGRPFEVAPECNGFGITSSCLLLGLLLAFGRRLRVVDKVLVIVLAPLIGLFSNALRIIIIVLLAPVAGVSGYQTMHEVVGTVLFLGTLAGMWWLATGLPSGRNPAGSPQRKSLIS